MTMLRHFGIYSNSGQVETAVENETLIKPYVAKVSGALDYNSYEEHVDSAWVVDSAGNTYSGTPISNYFQFDFYKPTGATWTLYYNGQVVTASSFYAEKRYTCQDGDVDVAEVVEETDYTVQNISIGTGDNWADSAINITMEIVPSSMEVSCGLDGEDCEDYNPCRGYEEGTQEKCECEGHYWYNDECHEEPDPCENPETDQDICECAGGSWNDDGSDSGCDVGTCNCSANGADYSYAECVECCANGGTWTDDGEGNWYCDTGDEPSE